METVKCLMEDVGVYPAGSVAVGRLDRDAVFLVRSAQEVVVVRCVVGGCLSLGKGCSHEKVRALALTLSFEHGKHGADLPYRMHGGPAGG